VNKRLAVSTIAFATIVIASACKKSGDDGKTGDKPAEKAAAPTCTDKALKHTNPNFCVDLPAGYEAQPEKKDVTGSMKIDITRKSDNETFELSWGGRETPAEEAIEQIKHPEDGEKIVEQGEMANGGYLVLTVSNNETTDNKDFYTVYSIARGPKSYVHCFGMNAKKDFIDDVMKVCKALQVD
jgi:hypothetical protein